MDSSPRDRAESERSAPFEMTCAMKGCAAMSAHGPNAPDSSIVRDSKRPMRCPKTAQQPEPKPRSPGGPSHPST